MNTLVNSAQNPFFPFSLHSELDLLIFGLLRRFHIVYCVLKLVVVQFLFPKWNFSGRTQPGLPGGRYTLDGTSRFEAGRSSLCNPYLS